MSENNQDNNLKVIKVNDLLSIDNTMIASDNKQGDCLERTMASDNTQNTNDPKGVDKEINSGNIEYADSNCFTDNILQIDHVLKRIDKNTLPKELQNTYDLTNAYKLRLERTQGNNDLVRICLVRI
jgi:hypothetical protein